MGSSCQHDCPMDDGSRSVQKTVLMIDTSFAGEAAKSMFGELPMNTPVSVARGIAQASADPSLNGKTFWVMDNELTEIEGTIESTMDAWLGKKNSQLFR